MQITSIIPSHLLVLILSAGVSLSAQSPECDRTVPGAVAPSWSSDGQQIVYSTNRDGNWEVYATELSSGAARRLTWSDSDDYFPYFSPDNKHVLFMAIDPGGSAAHVAMIDAGRSAAINLTEENLTPQFKYSGDPHWSPGADRIAFYRKEAGNSDIFVMDLKDRQLLQLTSHEASDTNPIWSPDGQRLLFVSSRDGNSDIFVMNADGSNPINLSADSLYNYFPFWSTDGQQIVFSARKDRRDSAGMELYVMSASGENRRRLTVNQVYDSAPHWSPDDSRIAFASCRSGGYEIHIMKAGNLQSRRITFSGAD